MIETDVNSFHQRRNKEAANGEESWNCNKNGHIENKGNKLKGRS